MNAAVAAAAGGLQVPAAVPPTSFTDYYNDTRFDEYQGNYVTLMQEFHPATGRAPGELRGLASSNPASSLGYLYLISSPP